MPERLTRATASRDRSTSHSQPLQRTVHQNISPPTPFIVLINAAALVWHHLFMISVATPDIADRTFALYNNSRYNAVTSNSAATD